MAFVFGVSLINAQANAQSPAPLPLQVTDKPLALTSEQVQAFANIYAAELGDMQPCDSSHLRKIIFCFESLRNKGNAPFIVLPNTSAKGVVVLFHGLSDSPYFMSSIAAHLRLKGYIVISPLTPGHGKQQADADMQDDNLKARWLAHLEAVMDFAHSFGLPTAIGGFSTGGAFATYYTLQNPDKIDALLLFSGALKLSSAAESMAKVWGMKTIAKWLDGDYQTHGPHPYKYPSVATYSALVLIDIINDIRKLLEESKPQATIFAAHSLADVTTLYEGIEDLTSRVEGRHTVFKVDESYDLCHADLPMSAAQIINLSFDKTKVKAHERCAIPKANPLHPQMLLMLTTFLDEHIK